MQFAESEKYGSRIWEMCDKIGKLLTRDKIVVIANGDENIDT